MRHRKRGRIWGRMGGSPPAQPQPHPPPPPADRSEAESAGGSFRRKLSFCRNYGFFVVAKRLEIWGERSGIKGDGIDSVPVAFGAGEKTTTTRSLPVFVGVKHKKYKK